MKAKNLKSPLEKLLQISSAALAPAADLDALSKAIGAEASRRLAPLLQQKNGFYAFYASLHLLPFSTATELDLVAWNRRDGWRKFYGGLDRDAVFFAQDLFGGQFALLGDGISRFDPETAEFESLGRDIEQWCAAILADYDYLTGCSLAAEWQQEHGALEPGHRLFPKLPFVLGGEYEIDNLWSSLPQHVMEFRGFLASKIHGLSDGTAVRLVAPDGRTVTGVIGR